MEFATKTIHASQPSEPHTGAVVSPIFQTTTYQQLGPGEHRGFDYTRTSNPTRQRLESVVEARRAQLEQGERAQALEEDRLDLTEVVLSSVTSPTIRGHRHLVSITRDALDDVFVGMGFTVAEGPDPAQSLSRKLWSHSCRSPSSSLNQTAH